MEKIITISGKDFKIKSSAFTPFAYKNEIGRDLLSDINKINQLNVKISKIGSLILSIVFLKWLKHANIVNSRSS